jgi:hypothetical protein
MDALSVAQLCAREYQDILYERVALLPGSNNVANWLEYLNDAQRAIVLVRPDAGAENIVFKLDPGTRQKLPPRGVRLLDVSRNMGIDGQHPGDVIMFAEKESQDMVARSWHSGKQGTVIRDAFYNDKKNPYIFWVSPPVHDTIPVFIEAEVACTPADVVNLDAGTKINLSDIYAVAMQQWMLYRAHALATQAQYQFARAQFYFSSFFNTLGIKTRTDMFFAAGGKGAFPAQGAPG